MKSTLTKSTNGREAKMKIYKGYRRKAEQNSHAASGIIFRISKWFIRSKHKLSINFLFKKAT
jgi:hypothetical protein